MVDTHTHLYLPDFPDPGAQVRAALAAGVRAMVTPNVDAGTVEPMLRLCREFPGVCHPALGLHPTELGPDPDAVIDGMEAMLRAPGAPFVAVGEVGMDLYWDASDADRQQRALDRQLRLAADLGLPAIIHCRSALEQTLEVVSGLHGKPQLLMHCWGGDAAHIDAVRRVAPDAWFGIGGVVTFKNSALRSHLAQIGIGKIVLETDSPYLAPVPHRGRQNTSAYLPLVAAEVARSLGMDVAEVGARTTANAVALFRLPPLPSPLSALR